jgi:phosphate acyltransferase
MVKVALDAMGGDHAPSEIVKGAVLAVKELKGDLSVYLTGPEHLVRDELNRLGEENNPLIHVVHAPDLVEMDESPAVILKTKPESGLVKCVALQKAGVVQASVSAGNSGAMMAACLMLLGRIGKVSRPAIACVLPSMSGRTVLLDCGANVDEKPATLLDFAICGSVFAEHALGYDNPTVGLVNIGEEEKKGNEQALEAYQLLKNSSLNFVGNIEGGDILKGTAQVMTCSGFVGNIILKLMEGFFHFHTDTFGLIPSEAGKRFQQEWDYENHGGALLLGLNGHGIISHGKANANAIRSALVTAHSFANANISERIAKKLQGERE